ncbi:patatin-like phospholipase family protein [Azospirillum sp. SYSU D00513]|uniref:patatin-like phospholipase family protein n=1 Tax=Azospirillum sp. SYSU D00513 TaxID=2812561 RepID=UPI001A97629B|nr:patatin-like phospholipase family protein [Azospirillum sp. SYSU D00513]
MTERITLVLGGGNALGAYQGGAYEALHARGLRPDRMVAVSTGAINAAIIAGNPPEQRVEKLRGFWESAAQDSSAFALGPAYGPMTWGGNRARALQSSLLGSPAVFRPRFPGALSMLPGMPTDTSIYELDPLRESLKRALDFERLNGGEIRLVVVAVDGHSGEEARFDTAEGPIGVDHLLASCGFPPFFPPVEIDGRLYFDGGMGANLPIEAALEEPDPDNRLCIALDLFRRQGGCPRTVGQAMDRQLELLLSTQTWRAVKELRRVHALRRQIRLLGDRLPAELRADPALAPALAEGMRAEGAVTLLLLSHASVASDVEMRAFDFSRPVLTERWESGRADMEQALHTVGARRAAPGEFALHAFSGGEPAEVDG